MTPQATTSADSMLQRSLEQADATLLGQALAQGADLTMELACRQSPLHLAAALPEADCLEILLAAGADPDAQDEDGNTAILAACFTGRESSIQALIAAGADPRIPSHQGRLPLELCIEISKATAIIPGYGERYGRIIAMIATEIQKRETSP